MLEGALTPIWWGIMKSPGYNIVFRGIFEVFLFFETAASWHVSLIYTQFCFLCSVCFSITSSIILCIEVKGYKIIKYAWTFTWTEICVCMNLYGMEISKSWIVWKGGGRGHKIPTNLHPMSMSYLYSQLVNHDHHPLTHIIHYLVQISHSLISINILCSFQCR